MNNKISDIENLIFYNETYDFKEDQLILVVEDEAKRSLKKMFMKFLTGHEQDFYKKGDVFVFKYQYSKEGNGKLHYSFLISRGHDYGKYQEGNYIDIESTIFNKRLDKDYILIDDIAKRNIVI